MRVARTRFGMYCYILLDIYMPVVSPSDCAVIGSYKAFVTHSLMSCTQVNGESTVTRSAR